MIEIIKIKEILKNMYPLIIKGDDHTWAEPIRIWYAQIDQFPKDVMKDIIRCSFGRDSLCDMHITKDTDLLEEDDAEFCSLRDNLIKICEDSLRKIY